MNYIDLKKENIYKGNLILINKDYPININVKKLEPFNENYQDIKLKRIAKQKLISILKKINAQDKLILVSGYRTKEEQTNLYENSLKENGEIYTKKYVAYPGTSEHQSGLAIDLGLKKKKIDFICPSFPHHGICKKFRKTMTEYGFIERYPKDKEHITNIAYEEWHFRYVGYPHSKIIKNNNFCLEEYIIYLKQFSFPNNPLIYEKYHIFYLPYNKTHEKLNLNDNYSLSGNNVDGFILTIKKAYENKNKY